MLRMAQISYIKDLYEHEGLSLREISRRTGFSFQTVRKYAYRDDWAIERLPDVEPEHHPILGAFIPTIDRWLEQDRKMPRKQRHTAKRVYDRLREEMGFGGSYSSVKRYIQKKKRLMRLPPEGYLPLAQYPGWGQVDFGEVMYYDGQGQMRKGYELAVSFPYSGKGYIQLFPSQNQECLLTGLQRIFEHIGGVPPRLRFDNMSTAVAQILRGRERVLTDGFSRFMLHYRFRAEFCNPAAGNEKGHVENKIGYIRRNAFVPPPTIVSMDAFNRELWQWCEQDAQRTHYKRGVPIQELWEADRGALLALPERPFPVFCAKTLTVSKCGFAAVDTNKYGLDPALAGETVTAKIFFDRVEFYHDRKAVGQYDRCYGRGREICDWRQYIGTLRKKPGAVEHTSFFSLMPSQWRLLFVSSGDEGKKRALGLLAEPEQAEMGVFSQPKLLPELCSAGA